MARAPKSIESWHKNELINALLNDGVFYTGRGFASLGTGRDLAKMGLATQTQQGVGRASPGGGAAWTLTAEGVVKARESAQETLAAVKAGKDTWLSPKQLAALAKILAA